MTLPVSAHTRPNTWTGYSLLIPHVGLETLHDQHHLLLESALAPNNIHLKNNMNITAIITMLLAYMESRTCMCPIHIVLKFSVSR